jgi:hypothetical protein
MSPIATVLQPFKEVSGRFIDPVTNLGTVVFPNPKAGLVMRQYKIPANPKSTQQVAQRGWFSNAATAYKSLTIQEASDWRDLAAQLQRTNILGTSYKYSGINIYCTVNTLRQMNGQSTTDVVPDIADIPIPVTGVTSCVFETNTLTLAVNCAGLANGAIVLMRMTPSVARQSRLARVTELRLPSSTETKCFAVVSGAPTGAAVFAFDPDLVIPVATQYVGLSLTAMSAAYLPREPLFIPQLEVAAP